MKAVRPAIASNGVLYLQVTSVESHSTSGREEEEKKEIFKLGIISTYSLWNTEI